MASGIATSVAKRIFLKTLSGLRGGRLDLVCPEATYSFGESHTGQFTAGQMEDSLCAVVAVHDDRFFQRALLAGDIGVGEAYMDGEWSTPDLVAVVRLAVRNLNQLENSNRLFTLFRRMADLVEHRRHRNTQSGSRRNIAYHYDLGNDFYRLFLDRSLAYSCAYFGNCDAAEDTLEKAQVQKFDRICRKLQLGPRDYVLEIGTGWGGFAVYAAKTYGCAITTTTISRQQYDYASELFSRTGSGERIRLLFEDYRNLRGQYDKIVSIEMFEAVGFDHYDDYFGACDRLLKPDGSMLLQTITILESKFQQYRKQSDWIKKHIFPGAELASVTEIQRSLARATRIRLSNAEDIGMHYALTLKEWRRRFLAQLDEVRQLGFDERFIHMWDYYLAYCEGAFRERYIGDVQLLLSKVTHEIQNTNEAAMELAAQAKSH
ncbi:MAG: cyclopropane-fatty-acyl-phospholipid synthase family protein [Terriglobales bacterium]|jgi:cyclopropane-fatty-acyl-phospholipid synthase